MFNPTSTYTEPPNLHVLPGTELTTLPSKTVPNLGKNQAAGSLELRLSLSVGYKEKNKKKKEKGK